MIYTNEFLDGEMYEEASDSDPEQEIQEEWNRVPRPGPVQHIGSRQERNIDLGADLTDPV